MTVKGSVSHENKDMNMHHLPVARAPTISATASSTITTASTSPTISPVPKLLDSLNTSSCERRDEIRARNTFRIGEMLCLAGQAFAIVFRTNGALQGGGRGEHMLIGALVIVLLRRFRELYTLVDLFLAKLSRTAYPTVKLNVFLILDHCDRSWLCVDDLCVCGGGCVKNAPVTSQARKTGP
uniref:Uncharacterized protein n=1 Tax=Anopheles coluzzii TaxID=1518534 RepID=A0A8W7P9L3_ANOCL